MSSHKILPQNNGMTIKVFGHSLNPADYSYFQSIFDYYNIYNSDTRLVFCYNSWRNSPKITHENNGMNISCNTCKYENAEKEMIDAVYKLIHTYGTTLSNKDNGKNLLHKLLLERRLSVVDVNFVC
ncbi:MAG: hypothetical protein LBK70_02950 [Clostridiales bacterium]|nr:hypothetical protein [Clostridiales bacterium]